MKGEDSSMCGYEREGDWPHTFWAWMWVKQLLDLKKNWKTVLICWIVVLLINLPQMNNRLILVVRIFKSTKYEVRLHLISKRIFHSLEKSSYVMRRTVHAGFYNSVELEVKTCRWRPHKQNKSCASLCVGEWGSHLKTKYKKSFKFICSKLTNSKPVWNLSPQKS